MVSQTDEVADARLATFLGLCDYLCTDGGRQDGKRSLHSHPECYTGYHQDGGQTAAGQA